MMEKSQQVRMIDVLFIGPFLIYVSASNKLSNPVRGALAVIGVMTILYNWQNYQVNLKA